MGSALRVTRIHPGLHAALGAGVLLVAATSGVFAQSHANTNAPTGTVAGRIVRSDGPKYDVIVMDQNTWITVSARPDGSFRLDRLPVGDHVLRVRSDYCEVQLIPVKVRAGQVSPLEIELACTPRPCPKPARGDSTCIWDNPVQRQRVGTPCEVHPGTPLKLDLVPIHYGIDGYTPGLSSDERKIFPNARPWWSAGCMDTGQRWAEVAYCRDCRMAFEYRRSVSRLRQMLRKR